MRPADAIYRLALRALPRAVRERDGEEMAALFAWQMDRAERPLHFAAGALADVAVQAWALRRSSRSVRRGAGLGSDLHHALRNVVRRPRVTVPVVATLALGLGLATAMVVVVREVLLKPLPYPDGDRIVRVREQTETGARLAASWANYADWRVGAGSFEALSAVAGPAYRTVLADGDPLRLRVAFVSEGFFRVAGLDASRGRLPTPGEAGASGAAVAVVREGVLERLGDGSVLEAQDLLGATRTWAVIGTVPAAFDLADQADVYLPLEQGIPWSVRGNHVVQVLGRLRPGVAMQTAEEELSALQARIVADAPGETEAVAASVSSLRQELLAPVRAPVLLLLFGAVQLLLTACFNATGVLLAHGVDRGHEMRVRMSLGATAGRLRACVLFESAVVAALAALLGSLLALAVLRAVDRIAPGGIARLDGIQASWPQLAAISAALAIPVLAIFGAIHAGFAARAGAEVLRQRGGSSRGRRRIWQVLIAGEVAVALMLLATAAVLGRSLWRIAMEDTGFEPAGVLTAQVSLPPNTYAGASAQSAWLEAALDRVAAVPGVAAVGAAGMLPIPTRSGIAGPIARSDGTTTTDVFHYRVADAGFFETLRIRTLEGRLFQDSDRPGAPHVAVIDAAMAARLWPGESAIGKRFHLGGMDPYRDDWLTVVGVVAEARPWSVPPGASPGYWVSFRQRPAFLELTGIEIVVRAPVAATAAVRNALAAVDRGVPVQLSTLDARLAAGTADRRFVLALLVLFAGLALVLCAVGIWGIVSFAVSRSIRETGIRLALGAAPDRLLREMQATTLVPVLVGALTGTGLAAGLIQVVRSLLFGVSAFDPPSLLGVAGTLLATAWLASWIPARRVRRLAPADALRPE